MIKQLWVFLFVIVLATNAFVMNRVKRVASFQEQEVKIIPTRIDINRLKEEAYATRNAGERFLPGESQMPHGLFGENRKK